jgi:hypothetical protein
VLLTDKPERLDHPGGQRRLGGDLVVWDRHWYVVVRQSDLIMRHEGRPWHRAHRVEHPRVIHCGPPSSRDQLL